MAATLSHRDHAAIHQSVVDLYDLRTLAELRSALPEIMLRLIAGDDFSLTEVGVDLVSQRMTTRGVYSSNPFSDDLRARMERTAAGHPFTRHITEHGPGEPLMVSDFMTRPQFRRTEVYNEYFRLMGVEQHLATAVFDGPEVCTFNFARGPRMPGFSERDRAVLLFLQPHVAQARRNAIKYDRIRYNGNPPLEHYEFTPREHEVAVWLAQGKTNPEIAMILGTSPRTVEKHIEKVLEKLGVENRVAAAVMIAAALGR